MSDVLSQFASILEQSSAAGGGSIELLVAQLGEEGELVRRCAIPHQFSSEILPLLDPSLGEKEALYQFHRLARLSLVVRSPDGLALHDRAREQLFPGWFAAERIGEFRDISGRLAAHLGALADAAAGAERGKLLRRQIFHLVAVDQDAGVAAFEKEFEISRDRLAYAACDNLLRMVREYDQLLTPANRARVAYRQGKLALDRANVESALELFTATAREPAVDAAHRAKAMNGIGLAHAEECHWKRSALAFLEALRFADQQPETHAYRCGFMLNLATVYRDTGNIEAAEALLQRSAHLTDGATHRHFAASIQNTFGTLYLRAGEPEKAITSLLASLDNLEPEDFGRARVYNNLGLASMRVPDFKSAEEWFNRSLQMKSLAGDTVGQANTQINLVRLYREQQWTDKAVAAAAIAADLYGRVFFWKEAADANAMLARFYLEARKPREAARALIAAFDAYDRAHQPEEGERLRAQLVHSLPKPKIITDVATGSADTESRIAALAEHLERQTDPAYAFGKSRWLALFLSLVVPGLGQFYNGDVKKGATMFAVSMITGLIRIYGEATLPAAMMLGSIAGLGCAIWSTTDAWRVAGGRARRW